MSRLHITLVGGQTAPVYWGIADANPDKVVLIYSDQTLEEANRIYNELSIECEIRKFHPVDLNDIYTKAEKCLKDFSTAESITINVGGGTKPWSVAFTRVFEHQPNTQIVYVDQNNQIWDLINRTNHPAVFDMDVQFRLYGNPLTKYQNYADYTPQDQEMIAGIREIRAFNNIDFNEITGYLYKHTNQTRYSTESGSSIEWDVESKSYRCRFVQKNGRQMTKTFGSPNIRQLLLNTGWFEYEVATLLAKWNKTKEIRMNCIFPATQGGPKNEVDLIVNTGTKLLFVECKTKIFNETDIDKFSSAVKNYGGMGSKALFVTDVPMSEKANEKCRDNGIMTFSLQNSMFGLSAEKMLFMMLDRELFNINAK